MDFLTDDEVRWLVGNPVLADLMPTALVARDGARLGDLLDAVVVAEYERDGGAAWARWPGCEMGVRLWWRVRRADGAEAAVGVCTDGRRAVVAV